MSGEDNKLDMRKHVPPEGRASARPASKLYRRHPIHLPPSERHNRSIIIFVTVCTSHRRKILATPESHEAIRGAWALAMTWLVGRYVILPDHVHFFCTPEEFAASSLKAWMRYWKSIVTRNLCEIGETVWQRHHWDCPLRRGESYDEKWEYVRSNPVRHGLISLTEAWLYQGELNELRW